MRKQIEFESRNHSENAGKKPIMKRLFLKTLCFILVFTLCQSTLAFGVGMQSVCEINGNEYLTLDEALSEVQSGQTIKLLMDIEHNGGIEIIDKRITFDLNGFSLNVVNPVEVGETREISALYVVGDAGVELENEGELNVTGKYGVFAAGIDDPTDSVTNYDTSVTVTSVTALGDDSIGLAAYNAKVTVKGSVVTDGLYGYGVDANFEHAEVTVEGNVNVTGEQSIGVMANSFAIVTVDGSITVNGEQSYGIRAYDEGEVDVSEDVTASGEYSTGIYAADACINVYGDVTGDATGISTLYSSVSVYGNVRALNLREFCYGVRAEESSDIYIGGNVESQSIGVFIPRLMSEDFWQVIIDGVIEAPGCYIQMGENFFDFEDGIPFFDNEDPGICYRAYEYRESGVYVAMFAGGNGSVEDPYLISHAHQLFNISCLLDKHFLLTEDIDLSGYTDGSGWEPIGRCEDSFCGTFDGDMHTISGLFIEQEKVRSFQVPAGLFGYTGETAEIRNLILEDVDITGCYNVGGLVGDNSGNITNVSVSGNVKGEWNTGGLVGLNKSTISDSAFTGNVTGTDEIEYGDWTGGLVGINYGTISNCKADATVESDGKYIGGLVGESMETGAIIRSRSACTVLGGYYIGGLIGLNRSETADCYSKCMVGGNRYVGGLVGSNLGDVSNSFAAGIVGGNDNLGGLIGIGGGEAIDSSYWDTEISHQMYSDGGTGKTTAEMKQQETYIDWDFASIWSIDKSNNDGYPFLRWQVEPTQQPVLSQTGIQAGSITAMGATLEFASDEAGTYYYLVYTAENAAPDAAAIKAQGAAVAKGSGAAGTENAVAVTELTASTAYKAYIIVEDAHGNVSNIAVIAFTTATDEIATYALTVVNGTGSGKYQEGANVTITADIAPAGKEFDKWTTSDGVTFANSYAASTSFTMLGRAVTVTAGYKDLLPETYAINIQNDGNGTATASATSAVAGAEITLTATANSGYRFKEWKIVEGNLIVTGDKFIMPANTVSIKAIFEKIPAKPPYYKIIKGAHENWGKGSDSEIEIICNGDFSKFTGVRVDGALLTSDKYIAESGSTVITLKPEYLSTLAPGEHTIEILYTDGSVKTKFTVEPAETNVPDKIPQTGGDFNTALLFVLVLSSGAGILGTILFGKKRRITKKS